MKQSDSYDRSIHRTGRLGSILAIAWMLGIPAVMCTVYHMFPSIPDLLLFGSGLLALYVPTAISEVITYVPMLGSASYITFITGNISNLKLPCALNALEMADVEQNTDAGDAVATVAVAVSSIVTTVIIVLGVLLLVPLHSGERAGEDRRKLYAPGALWVPVPQPDDQQGGRHYHQGQAQGRRPPRRAGLSDPRVRHTSQPRHRHPGLHPPVHPVRLGAVPDGADPGGPSSPGWGPVTGKERTSYELSSERSGAV